MRRADRLFQIIQILRRSSRPVTAAALAEEIEVSRRTVYRDISDLIGQRVPIVGEAGLGYQLGPEYDMPPLMLTADEIEAVVLGAQWVAGLGDKTLSNAARDVVAKISEVLPKRLKAYVAEPSVGAKPDSAPAEDNVDTLKLRRAIHEGRKVRLSYRAGNGEETHRIVWPIMLGYDAETRLLIAWCELRQTIRHFRTDRVTEFEVMETSYGRNKGELRRYWELWREEQLKTDPSK